MKLIPVCFLFCSFLILKSYGQVKDANQNLKQQAGKMGAAFISKDYKTFSNFTYPLILKSLGGAANMMDLLTKSANDMQTKGISFTNITFDEPSKIIKAGKELQSTIAQHTEIKLSQGSLISTSTLIAISTDNGTHWTFVDTSNKDITTLRKALPNLSNEIIIPPQQPPVRYN